MDVNFSLLSSVASTSVTTQRHATFASPAPLPGSSVEKRSSFEMWTVSAVVIGDQHIGPSCGARLSVRLKNAPVGRHVISAPDFMRVHRLSLESTLSTVRADHISDALVTNKTGSSITLKNGVLLATYEVLDLFSLEESFPLPVAGVTAHDADVTDLTNVMAQLKSHVNVLDYPATKPALLQLL